MSMDIEQLLKDMTLEEKASLCSGHDFWHTKTVERLGIPAVMMCDGPNGLRKQEGEGDHLGINESIKAVCFPTSSAVAASFDVDMACHLGEVLGNECQAENIAMLLGPGMNIKRSPLCGRNFEYYSEDPYVSSQMGKAYIEGIQSRKVGACVKHFATNNQETRRMNGDSVVDERTWHEIYLESFRDAISGARPVGVMCAYNKTNGTYAAESRLLLTDILRKAWGYEGFVVTDWGAVKDRVKGVAAGLDLEMPGGDGARANDAKIVKAVQDGTLTMEQLDAVVKNVLTFVKNAVENRDETAVFDREADYREAVKMAENCAVLLKNEDKVLPLEEGKKIAFVGGFVEKPRCQGSGSSHINSTKVPSIAELIAGRDEIAYAKGFDLDAEEPDESLQAEAAALAKESDVTVIFAGLPNRYESEGADRKHMRIPENQNALISAVAEVSDKVAVVLFNGSPVEMPWKDDVEAILEMYLGGDGVSEAAMALLYGEANPSGKLAETFPVKLADNPSYLNFPGEAGVAEYHEGIYVGYRYYDKKEMEVLFPFGHGLSYTTFAYSDLKISAEKITDQEKLTVSVTVTNTGDRAGKEVVQLYVGSTNSSVRRPVRELKRFAKVALNPGESREVTFTLDAHAFAYYEVKIHDFYVESGEYVISVGSSSRDIRCEGSVAVEGTKTLPITVTRETLIGELAKLPAGRAMLEQLVTRIHRDAPSAKGDLDALGEGRKTEAQKAMFEMPLGALATYGVMGGEQLDHMIAELNGQA